MTEYIEDIKHRTDDIIVALENINDVPLKNLGYVLDWLFREQYLIDDMLGELIAYIKEHKDALKSAGIDP